MLEARRELTRAAVAVVCVLAAAWFCLHPGPLSIDEVTYLLMARSFAAGGGVTIGNGYEELQAGIVAAGWTKVVDGRVVSQYPDLWTALVAPLFARLGFAGLFVANVAAFLVALWAIRDLSWRCFRDRAGAALAVALFAGATYSWEYAVAAWPHMLEAALVVCAASAVLRSVESSAQAARLGWAAAAGGLLGLATGVRLDAAFALAAFAIVFVLAVPARAGALAAYGAGALPGLLALAALNRVKFGVTSPFSYGPSWGTTAGVGPYLPLAAGGLVGLGLVWLATRPAAAPYLHARWRLLAALFAGATALLLLWPPVRALAWRTVHGMLQLVADLRLRPLDVQEGALSRGPDGSLVYAGVVKKALLQSCPYLVLAVAPLVGLLKSAGTAARGLVLAAVPAAFVIVFGAFAWHGGLCFNLRYFVPLLPFAAILSARGLRRLWQAAPSPARPAVAGALTVLALYGGRRLAGPFDLAGQGIWYLTMPLVLAAALAAALVATRVGRFSGAAVRAGCGLAAAAVVWATLVAFDVDLRATLAMRALHARAAALAREQLSGPGLLLSTPLKLFAAAADRAPVAIADPADDQFAGLRDLVARAEGAGWRVHYGLPRSLFDPYRKSVLSGLTLLPVREEGPILLLELRSAPPASASTQ